MEEFSFLKLISDLHNAVNQETHSVKRNQFTARVMIATRAIIAVTLLLMLVAGNLAWSATAASGPLCTLACCAGRAPHAAGSCMKGSCEAGVLEHNAPDTTHHSHHHHEEQQAQESDPNIPQTFAGAVASAGGSGDEQVPTIDATIDESTKDDRGPASADNQGRGFAISAAALAKPCESDCGACASGFAPSKRSRHAATPASPNHLRPLSAITSPNRGPDLTKTHNAFVRECPPRGPPPLPSC